MEKKRKRIIVIVSIILAIAIIVGIVFIIANKNSDDIKVYDNVYIITKEESQSNIPIRVTENELVFNEDQHYSKDDIIVSGVTDKAPKGFIRKVVKTDTVNNQYIVETTYACLTDVFEKAHVSKAFSISDEAVTPIDTTETNINAKMGTLTPTKSFLNTLSIGTIIPNENSEADLISLDIKKNITENIYVTGSVGYRPYLLIDFDIENHEIEYSMSIKNITSGRLAVELGAEKGFNESIELFSKNLPIIEFMVGEVPIIITNSVGATLDCSGGIRGSLGTEVTLDYENTTGFKYSSSTNKVEEIKENTYLGDGIEWNTKASASADIEVGVFIHIVSKLYDSTGVDLAAGITGGAEAEVMASPNKQFNNLNYAGNIGLNISPRLKGDIVVSVPVIDYNLIQQPLFELPLDPFWEKNWSSSGNWKDDINNMIFDSITPNSELYKIIYAILSTNKESIEYNNRLVQGEYRWFGEEQIYSWNSSDGRTGIDIRNAIPIYSIKDINNDNIPDLIIGIKENNQYAFKILFTFGEYENKKLGAGWEYITADDCYGYTTSELTWKEFNEFSNDLKIQRIQTKEEKIYSDDNFNVSVQYSMNNTAPTIYIYGTNTANKDYYISLARGKDDYLEADVFSNTLYIENSDKKFNKQITSNYWEQVKKEDGGYEFYIVISDMNGELFRKKLVIK